MVVVGAGATGLGAAWDLMLRGVPVTVVDQGDLAHGTSGRFHGLLHSGARYVLTDTVAAGQCQTENLCLRRIAASYIEDTGGLFAAPPEVPDRLIDKWKQGCQAVHIPVAASVAVEGLNSRWSRVFSVNDGVINGYPLLQALARGVESGGGRVLTHTRLVGAAQVNGKIRKVILESAQGTQELAVDAVVNAAGPWAGEVAALWGDPLPLTLSRGVMVLFSHRHQPQVINRLDMPGDGDILVPHDHISIWGTTDRETDLPAAPSPDIQEVFELMERGQEMFPDMGQWRVLRAFTGVRPLYRAPGSGSTPTRDISRDFVVVEHPLSGAFSVIGGKWTTFRLMAQQVADRVAGYLHYSTACQTQDHPLPPRVEGVGAGGHAEPLLCECERVSSRQIQHYSGCSLTDLRTRTWFGMGPCQGTFCGHRVAAWQSHQLGIDQSDQELLKFRKERERGMLSALWGDNAVEWLLQRNIRFQGLGEPPK